MRNSLALEKFFQIRAEKQKHIVNAAFVVFGRQGYRKASIADIAKEAGTTKGMITYYFGSKKTLYLYLVEVINSSLIQTVKERLPPETADLFERMRILIDIQLGAIKEFPGLLSFVNSTYYETDPAVTDELERISSTDHAKVESMLLDEADFSRFNPEFAPQLIRKLVLWASEGFSTELCEAGSADKIDDLTTDFYGCLDMMKRVFYK